MSKQSDAKIKQGYTKETPRCAICEHFTFEKKQFVGYYGSVYNEKKNMRCAIGGLKCSSNFYCNEFKAKETK